MDRKPYPRIRLFKSHWMEKLSVVHPSIPACVCVPIISLLLIYGKGDGQQKGLAYGVGILGWTLLEYGLHRFVFHFRFWKRFTYIMHGIHHDDPHNPLRLVMPPVPMLLITILLALPLWYVIPQVYLYAAIAGTMTGYLAYDYTHYYLHHFAPKMKLFKYLRKNHYLHHYKTSNKKYGVTSPLWDWVFGTY